MTSTGQLTARQRGHVHMHSSIFSGGSEDASVYAPGRQAEVYESLRGSLRQANGQPPELGLPSPLDMRATEMAGHRGLVLPSGSPEQRPQRMHATTSRTTLVHDGEAAAVVHAQGRDATIPREFWATSVNLQWCDSRHELCRPQARSDEQPPMDAHERKQLNLSSEILGCGRLAGESKVAARRELLADDVDHLQLDSRYARLPKDPAEASYGHREHVQRNLRSSMDASPAWSSDGAASGVPDEDPAHAARRRGERNFSDLFDAQMGDREPRRARGGELLEAWGVPCMDARTELAARGRARWADAGPASAPERKEAEAASHLFDHRAPARVPVDPEYARVSGLERSLWESTDGMQTSVEIARRRVGGDFRGDFDDAEGRTHHARKQEFLASEEIRKNFGAAPTPPWQTASAVGQPRCAAEFQGSSAKDRKLAFLQSGIFS